MAARKRAAGQQLESMFEEGGAAQEGSAAAAIEDEVAAAERQYTAELQAELRAARAEAAEADHAAAAAAAPDQVREISHSSSCWPGGLRPRDTVDNQGRPSARRARAASGQQTLQMLEDKGLVCMS